MVKWVGDKSIGLKPRKSVIRLKIRVVANGVRKKNTEHDDENTPPIAGLGKSTYLPTIIWLEIRRIICVKASSTDFPKFQIENIASQNKFRRNGK